MPITSRYSPADHDTIVIGAGSAGCAAAARLSEDPDRRVLLLEAGPRGWSPWLHIPIGYYRTIGSARYDWGYTTEPVPKAGGREIKWPRGRVLGGTSAINGLVYTRGQREDFDLWRQFGNAGWSYDDVLPVFKRAEKQQRGESEYHGAGGKLGVSNVAPDPLCDAYIEAAMQHGLPRNDDFNGALQEGVGYFQLTTWNGLRASSARSYLTEAGRRPNLTIATGALAQRLLIENGRAVGVRFEQNGRSVEARAGMEVVISGGSINSPQLLQLSGIGPAALLRQHGIDVAVDLPGVGENLQDHYQCRLVYRCTRPITVNDEVRSITQRAKAGLRWLANRDGPLAIGAGHVGLFARSNEQVASPDVQFHFIRFSTDGIGSALHDFPGFTVSVCQLRPESRGRLAIRSADPREHPLIQPNYLDSETDVRTMRDGVKLARAIAGQPALADLIDSEIIPGMEVPDDDASIDAYVANTGTTIYHPTSTCRMGPDDMSVVDERLRVKGIEGLRVADASIMPTVVSANTNASSIMIGERVAEFIAEEF